LTHTEQRWYNLCEVNVWSVVWRRVKLAERCMVRVAELKQIYRPITDEMDAARRMLADRVASGFRMVGNGRHSEPYILSGKLIRPALFLLSKRLIDVPLDEGSVEMAAACEMLHLASLIHDDVLDEADLRRGVPSVNALWGNRTAVLVGDWLVAEALNVLSQYGGQPAVETMLDVMKQVLAGEMMQVRLGSERVSLSKEQYFDIIRRKTASLLQVVCQLPAITDGGNGVHKQALGAYGHNFGMAVERCRRETYRRRHRQWQTNAAHNLSGRDSAGRIERCRTAASAARIRPARCR